jgi:outer membrane protein assembly factor BamB
VNASEFGKLFSLSVDAGILAQPVYVPALQIAGGMHNVIYIATEHNSLYAFDADNGAPLWSPDPINFGPYLPADGCPGYDTGIMATPVIDPASNTIYVEAKVIRRGLVVHELHALDITTGAERDFSPVTITGSTPGTGPGSVGSVLSFDPAKERPRAALLLDNGLLYVGFATNCDLDPETHGWIFAYDALSLQQKSLLATSPNGSGAGIWAAGGGPAADADHNIYFATGEGLFDVNQGGADYGDSLIKVAPGTLHVLDYFTPFNQEILSENDLDLGAGGILLLPDRATSPHHLMTMAGKEGVIYLVNRDHLGQFNSWGDKVVNEENRLTYNFSTPSFWNKTLYFVANQDYPKAFSLSGKRLSNKPTSHGQESYPYPGAITVVSANGRMNGILWALQRGGTPSGNEVLRAYNATNLGKELYNSDQAEGGRDWPGVVGPPFQSILVANGKVYVPTGQEQVAVFGLLSSTPASDSGG